MSQAEIANLLQDNINEIVQVWTAAVRKDERIISDGDLTEGGLIDHVPVMLAEICELLRQDREPAVNNTHEARVHAYTRYCQGYRARDLVREVSLLRLALIDYLNAGWPDHSHGFDTYTATSRIINLYLDEELRYAISIYTEGTQREVKG